MNPLRFNNPGAGPATMVAIALLLMLTPGCVAPRRAPLPSAEPPLPSRYTGDSVATNVPVAGWRDFFHDPVLTDLISTALTNNQELNILLQEVAAAKAETGARKGALFPFLRLGGTAGTEKVSANTRDGAVEENLPIQPGRAFPEPLSNFGVAADFEWEVDIWRKLRNERDAAIHRYLATREGRNFMVTRLVAEIAEAYYELLALDRQAEILGRMIDVQEKALESVRLKKTAGRVTELAVRRFEAEVFGNRGRLQVIRQRIIATENRLNALAGRYPAPIGRRPDGLEHAALPEVDAGLPAALLRNRPDIRQAERELTAAGLEVRAAAARFYPAVNVSAVLGLESFTLGSPIAAKENLVYGAAANLAGPLINRSAIQAAFRGAQAEQVAAVYRYQQAVLKAYVEVVTQMAQIRNAGQTYDLKSRQADALSDSVSLSSRLFDSARADYTEVLLTQREALEAQMEMVESRMLQLTALIGTYRAIGGGTSEGGVVATQVPAPQGAPGDGRP